MQDICTYRIEVRGQVDESNLNTMSPLEIKVEHVDLSATLFTVHTDQSGFIGLLRYLHQQGFVLLSVDRSVMNEEVLNEKRSIV
jgi:hypothetical protein